MILPVELKATTEDADNENSGDEPEVYGFKSRGKAAKEDDAGPDKG